MLHWPMQGQPVECLDFQPIDGLTYEKFTGWNSGGASVMLGIRNCSQPTEREAAIPVCMFFIASVTYAYLMASDIIPSYIIDFNGKSLLVVPPQCKTC